MGAKVAQTNRTTSDIKGLQNVELRNAGLGARQDTVVMLTKDRTGRTLGGGSRLVAKTPENLNGLTESVNIVALDDVVPIEQNVSIIQLDVEGYEKLSLTGTLKTISRCSPVIVSETLPDGSWLSGHILRLGFSGRLRVPWIGNYSGKRQHFGSPLRVNYGPFSRLTDESVDRP